jgi:hypothetical protein
MIQQRISRRVGRLQERRTVWRHAADASLFRSCRQWPHSISALRSFTTICTPSDERIPVKRLARYINIVDFSVDELSARFDELAQGQSTLESDTLADYIYTRILQLEMDNQLPLSTTTTQITMDDNSYNNSSSIEDRRRTYAIVKAKDDNSYSNSSSIEDRRRAYAIVKANKILATLQSNNNDDNNNTPLTKHQFTTRITELATAVDFKSTLPIISSMLLVGLSVGVVSPAMPFVVVEVGLSSSEFGLIVSAFGLAKMMGNIPSAIAVERHGRKPYMTYSLAVVAAGTGGIGLSSSFEELYVCRLLTGEF